MQFFQSVGLLLAVLESQQEVGAILLPSILKLDVSSLLVKLLAFEMSKLKGERIPERYILLLNSAVLDKSCSLIFIIL